MGRALNPAKVDNDCVVVRHGMALLATNANVVMVEADLRTPRRSGLRLQRLGWQCLQGTVRWAAGGWLREVFSRRENGRRLMAQTRRFHACFIPLCLGLDLTNCAIEDAGRRPASRRHENRIA
jgi:hypothetical protein